MASSNNVKWLEGCDPLFSIRTHMDPLVMKLPSSSPLCAVVLDWFDSRERSEARDGHQFQPGGPVDRLQVSRGQEARESSC